jgi:hypothetical protein
VESNPIERWKTVLKKTEIAQVESLIGNLLRETEYELASTQDEIQHSRTLAVIFMDFLYPIFFDVKLWLKTYTPLARMGEIRRMGISDPMKSNAAAQVSKAR